MKLLAAVLVILSVAGCGCNKDKDEVERQAWAFVKKMGLHVTGVECVTRDSDSNGYVTCSAFLGDGQEIELECAFAQSEDGCKKKR